MGLLNRLLNRQSRPLADSRIDDLQQLRQAIGELKQRTLDLEAERVTLMAEWAKTRQQVLRHLQRAAQFGALDGARDDDHVDQDIERLKFPRIG